MATMRTSTKFDWAWSALLNVRSRGLQFFLFCALLVLGNTFASAQTRMNAGATLNVSMTQGQAFSEKFDGTGTSDNTYTLSGTLPPGISISSVLKPPPSTGNHDMLMSGTPSAAGTYTFNIDVAASNFTAPINYTTTLVVTVTAAAPVANNVSASVVQNSSSNSIATSTTGSVTSISIISTPTKGTATVSGTNIIYTPNNAYTGSDSLIYRANGPGGSSGNATLSLTVTPLPPTVNPSNATVPANSSNFSIEPAISGNATSVAISANPSHGFATVSGTNILYTPNAGYSGSDAVSITASGPGGTSAAAVISINVTPPAPTANNSNAVVLGNSNANLLSPTVQGSVSSISILNNAQHGTASISGLNIVYTPNPSYTGNDSITFIANGPGGSSGSATISINVTTPAPSSVNSSASVATNSSGNLIAPSISGNASSISISTAPTHGSASVNGLNLIYTPNNGYYGTDQISFIASGPGGNSTPATVSINVVTPAPVIETASFSFAANSSNNLITPSITGIINSISIASAPAKGTVNLVGTKIYYTPNTNFSGTDQLSVYASGPGGVSPTSIISIVVTPPPPVSNNTSFTVIANSVSNTLTTSISGNATTVAISTPPQHGTVSTNGLNLIYTPNAGYSGTDSIGFTASGPGGNSAPATISITVTPLPPTISPSSITVNTNSVGNTITPSLSGLTTNLAIVNGPTHGLAQISGLNILYTPSNGYFGEDQITVLASGPGGNSAPAQISIIVVPPAPTVNSSALTVAANSLENSLANNASGQVTGITISQMPAHGTAKVIGSSLYYTPLPGYSGGDSIVYFATGPGGASLPATVTITVTPPIPVVATTTVTVASNSTANLISPTITGSFQTLTISTAPAHGTAVVNGNNIAYTPMANFVGEDSLMLSAQGIGGNSLPARISITVLAPPPSMSSSSVTLPANSKSFPIATTSTGSVTSVSIVSAPANGIAAVSGTNLIYTPNLNYFGPDSISVIANGPGGSSTPAIISITVTAPAPTVETNSFTVSGNSIGNILRTSVQGAATSLIISTPPQNGSASVNGLNVIYTPNNDFAGSDAVAVTAVGPGGNSNTVTLSITVNATTPTASNSSITVPSNSTANLLTPTYSGTVQSITIVSPPLHGTASVNGLNIVYTPNSTYIGDDSLKFTVTGPGGISNTATVAIVVLGSSPIANNLAVSINTNSSNNLITPIVSGSVSALSIVGGASHGTVNINGLNLVYTPNPGFQGDDTVSYIASGPGGNSSPASISIKVLGPLPTATNSTIRVVANTTSNTLIPDISKEVASLTLRQLPSHGIASVSGLNIIYTPERNFVGTDSITFIGTSVTGNTEPAIITIEVSPTAPEVAGLSATVFADSRSNVLKPLISGNANALVIAEAPKKGTATISGLTVLYTPNPGFFGADQIQVMASGAGGNSSIATLTITVSPTAPTISDMSVTIKANSTNNSITPVVVGNASQLTITSQAQKGSVTSNGLSILYSPNPGYSGTDSFRVTATGLGGTSNQALITIFVSPPVPVINPLSIQVAANSVRNLIKPSIVGNATAVTIVNAPQHGTVVLDGLDLYYTPSAGYSGSDNMTISASNAEGSSNPVPVAINIAPIQISSLSTTVEANSRNNSITLPTINGALKYTISSASAHGTASLSGNALVYTPTINFIGTDTLVLSAEGSSGVFATLEIKIQITAVAPSATALQIMVESGKASNIDLARAISGPVFTGLSFKVLTPPAHGSFSLNGSQLSYVSNPSFSGIDTIVFQASTISGNSNPATLTITVSPRPDPSVDKGVLATHTATTTMVRHFEQVQIDQFNGRLLEIASQNRNTSATLEKNSTQSCNRMGAWFSGLNSYGSYRGRDGSKYTTMGYSAGMDRCFGSSSTTIGFGVGYARDRHELASVGANMTASANTVASYLTTQLIPSLRLSFLAGANQIGNRYQRYEANAGALAFGEWHGTQAFSSSAVSGDLELATIKFSPFVKLDLSNLSLDPYTESGATPYLLHYHQQSMRSQRSTVGFNSEMTIETPWGQLIPRLRMEVQKDAAKRNSLKINYVDFPDAIYLIPANELDRRAKIIAFGADMNWKNGIVTILNVTRSSANQNNQSNRINLRFSYNY